MLIRGCLLAHTTVNGARQGRAVSWLVDDTDQLM